MNISKIMHLTYNNMYNYTLGVLTLQTHIHKFDLQLIYLRSNQWHVSMFTTALFQLIYKCFWQTSVTFLYSDILVKGFSTKLHFMEKICCSNYLLLNENCLPITNSNHTCSGLNIAYYCDDGNQNYSRNEKKSKEYSKYMIL